MKKIRRVAGQSIVEFALVLPLILLTVIVFIDLGRIVYFHSALSNAVREGARYAIASQFASSAERQSGIQQKVIHYAIALPLNLSDISVYCERNPTLLVKDQADPCANYVTVSANIEIAPMIPAFAQIIGGGNTFDITAQSTMQMTPYGNYKE
ncbi:MAG: pilus assembly protein [Anaerolineales bacterium]|nr:pilus assembly protein [Anaerolineales bacterium]